MINLASYFGHLYLTDDLLLVATATQLHCFNPNGTSTWSSTTLGIDGVVVHHIEQDMIYMGKVNGIHQVVGNHFKSGSYQANWSNHRCADMPMQPTRACGSGVEQADEFGGRGG